MTRLMVARLEEFLLFAEKRVTIKIGIFPVREISAIVNSEAAMTYLSSLVRKQLSSLQMCGWLEFPVVVLLSIFDEPSASIDSVRRLHTAGGSDFYVEYMYIYL